MSDSPPPSGSEPVTRDALEAMVARATACLPQQGPIGVFVAQRALGDLCQHRHLVGVRQRRLSDNGHRRLLAAADAGHGQHTRIGAEQAGQTIAQRDTAGHRAGQAVADPHRDRRQQSVIADGLEVVVEARDLGDLGHAKLHLVGQCDQVALEQRAVVVVELVQQLDQPVTSVRPRPDQRTQFSHGSVLGLAAFQAASTAAGLAQLLAHRVG